MAFHRNAKEEFEKFVNKCQLGKSALIQRSWVCREEKKVKIFLNFDSASTKNEL